MGEGSGKRFFASRGKFSEVFFVYRENRLFWEPFIPVTLIYLIFLFFFTMFGENYTLLRCREIRDHPNSELREK